MSTGPLGLISLYSKEMNKYMPCGPNLGPVLDQTIGPPAFSSQLWSQSWSLANAVITLENGASDRNGVWTGPTCGKRDRQLLSIVNKVSFK